MAYCSVDDLQRIRVFVNRPDGIGFEDAEAASSMGGQGAGVGTVSSGKPQADFLLQEGTTGVTEYPVSISRFQSVNSVTLVVVSCDDIMLFDCLTKSNLSSPRLINHSLMRLLDLFLASTILGSEGQLYKSTKMIIRDSQ